MGSKTRLVWPSSLKTDTKAYATRTNSSPRFRVRPQSAPEAQGKDFGIIATENGYNLYVCGNGGMRPQHALLLATDLDEETLIKYIDRFLMFYVKTADRLQRTSTWFNNLEGGLEYLKQVVVEDSLGMAEELEAQMQHVVDTYQCGGRPRSKP